MAKKEKAVKKAKVQEEAVEGEEKQRGRGIGARARELIKDGKNFQETCDIIHEEFPGTHFGKNSYNWYRAKMVQAGEVERKRPVNGEGKKKVKKSKSKKGLVSGADIPLEEPKAGEEVAE